MVLGRGFIGDRGRVWDVRRSCWGFGKRHREFRAHVAAK